MWDERFSITWRSAGGSRLDPPGRYIGMSRDGNLVALANHRVYLRRVARNPLNRLQPLSRKRVHCGYSVKGKNRGGEALLNIPAWWRVIWGVLPARNRWTRGSVRKENRGRTSLRKTWPSRHFLKPLSICLYLFIIQFSNSNVRIFYCVEMLTEILGRIL